jgi:hypothetical protein
MKVYARQSVAQVGSDPEYIQLCHDNDGNMQFHHARNTVQQIKEKLENTVGVQQTAQKQVKHALKVYQRFIRPEEQEDLDQQICFRLIETAYYPQWTTKQQAYFKQIATELKKGQDYFLSFTQRNKPGLGNPVNSLHRHLIQSYGIADPINRPDNTFAEMLDTVLSTSRYQFRGFFFPTHEDDSAAVKEKVATGLERSRVFIQIIQNVMFSKSYIAIPNYCFDEYSEAVRQKKHMVYLFVDGKHPNDFILEDDAVFELEPWHKVIREGDCADFESTVTVNLNDNLTTNRERLKEKIVEKVEGFRQRLWENVPTDLD